MLYTSKDLLSMTDVRTLKPYKLAPRRIQYPMISALRLLAANGVSCSKVRSASWSCFDRAGCKRRLRDSQSPLEVKVSRRDINPLD